MPLYYSGRHRHWGHHRSHYLPTERLKRAIRHTEELVTNAFKHNFHTILNDNGRRLKGSFEAAFNEGEIQLPSKLEDLNAFYEQLNDTIERLQTMKNSIADLNKLEPKSRNIIRKIESLEEAIQKSVLIPITNGTLNESQLTISGDLLLRPINAAHEFFPDRKDELTNLQKFLLGNIVLAALAISDDKLIAQGKILNEMVTKISDLPEKDKLAYYRQITHIFTPKNQTLQQFLKNLDASKIPFFDPPQSLTPSKELLEALAPKQPSPIQSPRRRW